MRLSCSNCGAEYDVPDDVIPQAGRDVQCSNCGHIWFQHPVGYDPAPETSEPVISESLAQDDIADPTPEIDLSETDPDFTQDFTPEIAPDTAKQAPKAESTPGPVVEQRPLPPRPAVDDTVASILREEAAREARLREQDGASLAIQTDMGLEDLPPVGQHPSSTAPFDHPDTLRKGVLPDIEEINSTLQNTDDSPSETTAAAPVRKAKSGGFMRGFSVALIIGAALVLIYVNAPSIAKSVPQADPTLSAYVALVDQARVWLDGVAGAYLPKL